MEPDKAEWYYITANRMPPVLYNATCAIHECDSGGCRGFKALKQIVKIHFKLGNHKDMLQAYK